MSVEQTELRSRAARHAALGDPVRLAIVDHLTWGDCSPKDLQELLGISSNLMSHHLKVLQDCGIVARRRSEGDRRRTYLTLVRGSLIDLVPRGWGTDAASRIVFVCTANSARSQLAAALWRRTSRVPVASAGTHPADRLDRGAVAVARRHDLPLRIRRPRSVHEVTTADDVLITVCDQAHEELVDKKTIHWSVADPAPVGTDAAFDAAFDELSERVRALAPLVPPQTQLGKVS